MSIWFRVRDCQPSSWRKGHYDKQLIVLSDGQIRVPSIYTQNYFFEYGTNKKINEDSFGYWTYMPSFSEHHVIGHGYN